MSSVFQAAMGDFKAAALQTLQQVTGQQTPPHPVEVLTLSGPGRPSSVIVSEGRPEGWHVLAGYTEPNAHPINSDAPLLRLGHVAGAAWVACADDAQRILEALRAGELLAAWLLVDGTEVTQGISLLKPKNGQRENLTVLSGNNEYLQASKAH